MLPRHGLPSDAGAFSQLSGDPAALFVRLSVGDTTLTVSDRLGQGVAPHDGMRRVMTMDGHPTHEEREIVVVEADADLGHVVALALEHHGYPVRTYRSLADAWETAQTVPVLVVLDIGPATLDEWNAVAALKRHRLLGAAPVVVLSWDCVVAEGNGYEARVCLAKPFDARALDEAVAAILTPAGDAGTPLSSESSVPVPSDAVVRAEPSSLPSVWPMLTAGGGFVAVVGFMIHPIYIIGGLIVMIAALLRWALEPADSGLQV
jgi:CheY-like chemotaxis protein